MLGFQLFLPNEFRVPINLLWIILQLVFYLILVILGGWKIALGATFLLFFKLYIPVAMIAILLPVPNPLAFLFVSLSIVLIGVFLLSILCWRLAPNFSDPHLLHGVSVLGVMGSSIWLIVLAILWVFFSTL
jgi:hypothetical protein